MLNGPRAYFLDPDGTVLEFIDLTSYSLQPILRMPGLSRAADGFFISALGGSF